MKPNRHKTLALVLASLLLLNFLTAAAEASPAGTSESKTVKLAQSWLGVRDISGGNSRSGIDCSHLVYQVYRAVGAKGYTFMKVPAIKANRNFVRVASPRPGDLIVWSQDVKTPKRTYWLKAHVGISIGGNRFIHTSWDTKKVTTDYVTGVYRTGRPYYLHWRKK